jgi:hypothetical protein
VPFYDDQDPLRQTYTYDQPMIETIPQQQQTITPFSTANANDPTYGKAQFMQIQPDGSQAEYLPNGGGVPYMPQPYGGQQGQPQIYGGPQYASQGTIQPYQQPTPYQAQGYQPVQMQTPAYMNDPAYQQLEKQMAMQSMQNFLKSQQPKNSKWDGVRVFAQKIAPVVGAALGGGAVGGAMVSAQQTALNNSRSRKIAEQQQAIDALRATNSWVTNFGMKPLQQLAKDQNAAAKFNAGAQNTAAGKAFTADQSMQRVNTQQAGMNQRQANSLNFQGWKYKDNQARLIEKDQWNRKFKEFGMDVNMEHFDRLYDQRERMTNSLRQLQRLDRVIRVQGMNNDLQMKRATLLNDMQKTGAKLELDAEQFNGKMQFDLAKAQSEGKLPEGFDPQSVLLEFQRGTQVNPQEIGMSPEAYQGIMDQLFTAGDLGQPMQPQQRQGFGDAFTSQATMGQVAGQGQPGLQAVQGQLGQPMPQQPQMRQISTQPPQQQQGGFGQYGQYSSAFGAPQGQPMQQAPAAQPQQGQRPQMPKLSKIGQQAFQRINQKYKPEEAKMMLVRRLMQPPYNLNYEQASMKANGQ